MSDYGIQLTGYVRKPLAEILAEIEAKMITEFGPGVIQSSQSPLGQLNGMMADLVAEIDERNLQLYQSYDPDQAEGVRLETLSKLRLISRNSETDAELRKSVTNEGQSRVDLQDLSRAVKNVSGVTYVQVFVNETGEITSNELERGTVAVVAIGGDDEEIATVIRKYVAPGVNTYGNTVVNSNIDGFCRSLSIVRPVEVAVSLTIDVRTALDKFGCPPPAPTAIKNALVETWNTEAINGLDPSFYTIRTIIEGSFSNVEVTSVTGERDMISYTSNEPVPIGFIEIATLAVDDITVNVT